MEPIGPGADLERDVVFAVHRRMAGRDDEETGDEKTSLKAESSGGAMKKLIDEVQGIGRSSRHVPALRRLSQRKEDAAYRHH